MKMIRLLVCLTLISAGALRAGTVATALAAIDPATGAPKDTTTVFPIRGIISARATLPGGKILAFVQPFGQRGIGVLASSAVSDKLMPRNDISLTGKLAPGPFGWAVIVADDSSVTAGDANQPFGRSIPVSASFFNDASSLEGRFVQLTNVTFVSGKISLKDGVKVKADDGTEVSLLVTTAADGKTAPDYAINVFGVPVKVDGKWELLAARFLPVTGNATYALAAKYTCTTCHNPEIKVVGPSYRDVADKYKDDPDAISKFILQMQNGGQGKWGPVPMPPFQGKVPPEDMKTLANWIWDYRWDWILAE